MSEFSEFIGDKKHPEPNFGGVFECQTCGEDVYGAYRDVQQKALIWWCSKDHVSYIEKFGF